MDLLWSNGKRPDGATHSLGAWKASHLIRMKSLATVPDTYAPFQISETSENAGAAMNKAATKKIAKYNALSQHIALFWLSYTLEIRGTLKHRNSSQNLARESDKLHWNFWKLTSKSCQYCYRGKTTQYHFQKLSTLLPRENNSISLPKAVNIATEGKQLNITSKSCQYCYRGKTISIQKQFYNQVIFGGRECAVSHNTSNLLFLARSFVLSSA